MKSRNLAKDRKEISDQLSGKLALPFDPGLPKEQQKLWEDVLGLKESGDWLEADRPILRAYVQAIAAYSKMADALSVEGAVIKSKSKTGILRVIVNPLVHASRQQFAHARQLANMLGIAPNTRSQKTSGVTHKEKGLRAKQRRRAVESLSSPQDEGLLARPAQSVN